MALAKRANRVKRLTLEEVHRLDPPTVELEMAVRTGGLESLASYFAGYERQAARHLRRLRLGANVGVCDVFEDVARIVAVCANDDEHNRVRRAERAERVRRVLERIGLRRSDGDRAGSA